MRDRQTVSHEGIVEGVFPDQVRVRFIAHSACAACHARGVCSVSDSGEKFVDVAGTVPGLSAGDKVEVLLEQRQGFKAVWYGYGLPLIILLTVLFITYALTGRDGLAALIGLGSLVPYYLFVYLLRKRITGSMEFRLRRRDQS